MLRIEYNSLFKFDTGLLIVLSLENRCRLSKYTLKRYELDVLAKISDIRIFGTYTVYDTRVRIAGWYWTVQVLMNGLWTQVVICTYVTSFYRLIMYEICTYSTTQPIQHTSSWWSNVRREFLSMIQCTITVVPDQKTCSSMFSRCIFIWSWVSHWTSRLRISFKWKTHGDTVANSL